MSDIVERLWKKGETEAADEIERLRRLEKANDETIGPAMKTFEQVRAATIEECAQIAKHGAKQCCDGDSEWHRGFRYAAENTALFIEQAIRALKEQP